MVLLVVSTMDVRRIGKLKYTLQILRCRHFDDSEGLRRWGSKVNQFYMYSGLKPTH